MCEQQEELAERGMRYLGMWQLMLLPIILIVL